MKQKTSVDIKRIFHALGDPTRQCIVERLSGSPMSVSHLAEPFEMTLAAVVQHLQVLEESGLIKTEKVGRIRTCSMNAAGLDALQAWLDARRSAWEKRLDNLGDLLAGKQ